MLVLKASSIKTRRLCQTDTLERICIRYTELYRHRRRREGCMLEGNEYFIFLGLQNERKGRKKTGSKT